MKKYWFKTVGLVFVYLCIASFSWANAPLNDGIIAVVNSDVITLKDLKDYLQGVYRQMKVENISPEEIQKMMAAYEEKGVNQLIEDKLIAEAAVKKGIEIRPEIIDKRIKEIKGKYPSEDDFISSLGSQGMTVTDLKNKMITQMKSKYIVDIEVRDKVFVNPQDVTQYYDEHSAEFESKTKYNLDSIYISFDKGRDIAIKRIKEAREKIITGTDFSQIAKEYSQAPSVGALEEGQMVPAIEKEVFNLKQDDLSQPVIVEGGVYLFKVTGISLGRKKPLSEVKDAIYNKMLEQQFKDKFKVWLDKLRSKAYVEIRN